MLSALVRFLSRTLSSVPKSISHSPPSSVTKTSPCCSGFIVPASTFRYGSIFMHRSEEHTSELQSHRDLHSFSTRRSSDLIHIAFPSVLRYEDFAVLQWIHCSCIYIQVWVNLHA